MKYKMKMVLMFSVLTMTLFLSGCTVGQDYTPPELPRDLGQWQQPLEYGLSPSSAKTSQWWQILNDATLNKLIAHGLSSNTDLDQARSRVREARAKRGIETAGRFPMLNTSGTAIKTKKEEKPTVEQARFNLAGSQARIPPIQSDLQRAMNRLAVQSARTGVAKADLYPRFTFSRILQFSATDASGLFDRMSQLSSFGSAFQWNIFNAGSVRNNIKIHNERQQQALIVYEQTILQALEEVENAMVVYARELDRRGLLIKKVAAAQKSATIAELLYQNGLKDFIFILDSQRSLLAAEDDLAMSNTKVTADLIRIYKALGGGWDSEPAAGNG